MRQALRDLAALVARIGVGGIFFANGWNKLEIGLKATGEEFARQGAPAPGAWATVTMLTELIGGALLIAGLAVSVVGLTLFAEALAVFLIAPPLNPITLNEIILLGAAALLLAVVGAGRISVDHMVVIRRRESAAASEFAADSEADQVIASLREPDGPPPPTATKPARPPGGTSSGSKPTGSRPSGGKASTVSSKPDAADGTTAETAKTEGAKLEDTAPHPRPRRTGDAAPSEEPTASASPGDTLVAGRKKPPARGRRTPADD
ncbi:DoxX family protein [Nonomuraea cavernae]|uniref:DoxX family protein n=1 Tax=Nonomuraea cavernae TaxID=2045107 RepID=UPI00166A0506|nr:DoxX family protein [Nonomuraea cavernae]MCA2189602.1 DoxX family protein [Nonomuraea cavernae]